MEQEKEYYQREAAMTRQKQEFLRQFQHDLKNRLQVLNEIARRGNMVELEDYLWEIEGKYKEQELFSNTGNLIIDSIINCKLQDAAEKGIQVEASIALPTALEVKTDDMVVILGNLLDNAIEACMGIEEESQRFIRIYIDVLQGQLYLYVLNATAGILKRWGNSYLSTKDSREHGYGLMRMDRVVEKYHGYLDRQDEEGVFATEVLLPLEE